MGLDKFYTKPEVAKECYDFLISKYDIKDKKFLEPSAGNGSFSNQLNCIAYDIEPEREGIIKQDYLKLDLEYKKGRCIIGNPPFGRCLNLAQKFYKQAIKQGDYIAFILPISQLNNSNSMINRIKYESRLDAK